MVREIEAAKLERSVAWLGSGKLFRIASKSH
jgi:hypothetical protein